MHFDVLIVGAGHAGAQAAALLRQHQFAGSIALLGDEPHPPYERPPLSKDYLLGDKSFERILLRPENFWQDKCIALLTERRVVAVDPAEHRVALADGSALSYGKLIWATGGSPRQLNCPGASSTNVRTIRTRSDVDAIIAQLPAIEQVLIVGGGYIGLEAAAVLAKLGKQVVLVETLDRILSRVAGATISDYFDAKHRAHGVEIRTSVNVEYIEGDQVRLVGGDTISADLIIAGIGIIPSVQPLIAAGAEGTNGVDVDSGCRTSLPDIYAIGDCAAHENDFAEGRRIRLESVQNANDQAKTAALDIVGEPAVYDAIPWFWSNQYDTRLQTIGLSAGHDETELRGDPASGSFAVAYRRDGQTIALDCINSPKNFVQGRAEIMESLQRS